MSGVINPYLVDVRELYSFKKKRNTYYMMVMMKEPPPLKTPGAEEFYIEGKGNVIHIPITKKQYDFLNLKREQ